MKIGICFIGIMGSTASTFISGYSNNRKNDILLSLGCYWKNFGLESFLNSEEITFGGWDHRFNDINEAIIKHNITKPIENKDNITIFPSIIGPVDYASKNENIKPTHIDLENAINQIQNDIQTFKKQSNSNKIIIINTSSPSANIENHTDYWGSNTAYAEAAVREQCDWVEFTPSNTITEELIRLSILNKCRVAGRDGSTGQTILKLHLKEFLLKRGFKLLNWYSTNLIGNHDGLVLQDKNYNQLKLNDKASAINTTQLLKENHQIEINYCSPAGDNKESWDCVHFSGWLNNQMSLRVNWHGQDSHLASALILDIIISLIHAETNSLSYGLVHEMGLFFKNPIGCESIEFEKLYQNFIEFANINSNK